MLVRVRNWSSSQLWLVKCGTLHAALQGSGMICRLAVFTRCVQWPPARPKTGSHSTETDPEIPSFEPQTSLSSPIKAGETQTGPMWIKPELVM